MLKYTEKNLMTPENWSNWLSQNKYNNNNLFQQTKYQMGTKRYKTYEQYRISLLIVIRKPLELFIT